MLPPERWLGAWSIRRTVQRLTVKLFLHTLYPQVTSAKRMTRTDLGSCVRGTATLNDHISQYHDSNVKCFFDCYELIIQIPRHLTRSRPLKDGRWYVWHSTPVHIMIAETEMQRQQHFVCRSMSTDMVFRNMHYVSIRQHTSAFYPGCTDGPTEEKDMLLCCQMSDTLHARGRAIRGFMGLVWLRFTLACKVK